MSFSLLGTRCHSLRKTKFTLIAVCCLGRTFVPRCVLWFATSHALGVWPISWLWPAVVGSATSATLWSGSSNLSHAVMATSVCSLQLLWLLSNGFSLPDLLVFIWETVESRMPTTSLPLSNSSFIVPYFSRSVSRARWCILQQSPPRAGSKWARSNITFWLKLTYLTSTILIKLCILIW